MNPNEQKKNAVAFVERWKAAEGNEQRESNKFWIELMSEVLGVANPTHVLDFERKAKGRRIDVFHEDVGVLVENKSRGVSLDALEPRGKNRDGSPRMVTPYEQAKWYADNITPRSASPRWLVTCNFDEIRIYDLDDEHCEENYETLLLDEIPEQYHRLSFMVKKENSRAEREKDLSVKAGQVVGKLYDSFASTYLNIDTDVLEQRSLNILITRIVFLLYAEDAGILHEKDAFYSYLKNFQAAHMSAALQTLFDVLKTPVDERDPYMDAEALKFPYVNGGLFRQRIPIPQFTEDMRFTLLQEASAEFDWRGISPTIFGSVFESTLNPATRHAGGMHYTSVENIHKATGPLFYDALKDELTAIEGLRVEKERNFKLRAFREKLASIKVLDPACGSGNFLTETYLSLRKMENRILEDLYGDQKMLFQVEPIMVSTDQFYGIEINDFAVEVAKTALWIAELQMIEQTSEIMNMWIEPLPLKENENIWWGNALKQDWEEVLPASECTYIVGNPPFSGGMQMTRTQKEDMKEVFAGLKGVGELDYVTAWYVRAAEYTKGYGIKCCFVSTNSICQGLPVGIFWRHIKENFGYDIDFAYRTFVWNSEAVDQAHVHVVIVGFSERDGVSGQKRLFDAEGNVELCDHINGYLMSGDDVYVTEVSNPLSDVPPMRFGSMPRTKGFTLTADERERFIRENPLCEKWIHPYWGAEEFLNRKERYCLWLVGVDPGEISQCPLVVERVNQVRDERLASKAEGTRKFAKTPTLFAQIAQPDGEGNYLLVPRVSSERRDYIPIAFVSNDVIASDLAYLVPSAEMYHLGVMSSQFHNAWVRMVAGRMKSDYRYAKDLVYNTFVWPDATAEQRMAIEKCAEDILRVREVHGSQKIGDIYKRDKMPLDLLAAHKALDNAVEVAYGVNFGGDEEKIVAHLFKLYAEAVAEE